MMKNNKTVLFCIFFILLLGSCQAKQPKQRTIRNGESESSLEIDLLRNDKISAFELFDKIEIIPLETIEESLLNDPLRKIVLHNDKFYVFDDKQQVIVVFNSAGKFIERIDKRGQGKGEYINLYDFNFNRFTGNIELMSPTGQINVYDPDEYSYIETIYIPEVIHYFGHLTEDIYVLFMDVRKDFKMFFYSKSKKQIIAEAYEFPDYIMEKTYLHHTYSPFYEFNDSLFFIQAYNGQVFNINSTPSISLTERYKWDFGKHNLEISTIPQGEDYQFYINYLRSINYKYPLSFLLNSENHNFFITRFKYKHRYKNLIYRKKNRTYLLLDKFSEDFHLFPFFITDEALYACLLPQYLSYAVNAAVLNMENRNILKEIRDDNNPVIIKYSFK